MPRKATKDEKDGKKAAPRFRYTHILAQDYIPPAHAKTTLVKGTEVRKIEATGRGLVRVRLADGSEYGIPESLLTTPYAELASTLMDMQRKYPARVPVLENTFTLGAWQHQYDGHGNHRLVYTTTQTQYDFRDQAPDEFGQQEFMRVIYPRSDLGEWVAFSGIARLRQMAATTDYWRPTLPHVFIVETMAEK